MGLCASSQTPVQSVSSEFLNQDHLWSYRDDLRIPSTIEEEAMSRMTSIASIASQHASRQPSLQPVANAHSALQINGDSHAVIPPASVPARGRSSSAISRSSNVSARENDLLKRIQFFNLLSHANLEHLRSMFERRIVPRGTQVVQEGRDCSTFFIVHAGSLTATTYRENQSLRISSFVHGKWINASSLCGVFAQHCTVTADVDCSLFALDYEQFQACIRTMPTPLGEHSDDNYLLGTVQPDIPRALKRLPFFSHMASDKLQILSQMTDILTAEAGRVVLVEGEVGTGFFVLLRGQCTVYVSRGVDEEKERDGSPASTPRQLPAPKVESTLKAIHKTNESTPSPTRASDTRSSGTRKMFLDSLNAGSYFGETALLENTPRTATVEAAIDCDLLFLSGDGFHRFLSIAPELNNESFQKKLTQRTANILKSIPLFSTLMRKQMGPLMQFDSRLGILAELFTFQTASAGEILVREGERADAFYLITQGKARVFTTLSSTPVPRPPRGSKVASARRRVQNQVRARSDSPARSVTDGKQDDEVELGLLGPSEFFGEIALLQSGERVATVQAIEDCVFLKLTTERFERFLTIAPECKEALQSVMGTRVSLLLKQLPFFSADILSMDRAGVSHVSGVNGVNGSRKGGGTHEPPPPIVLLGALFSFRSFPSMEVVCTAGDSTRAFHAVVRGAIAILVPLGADEAERGEAEAATADRHEVEALKGHPKLQALAQKLTSVYTGHRLVNVLRPGAYFGELAIRRNTVQLFTAVSLQPSTLLTVPEGKFDTLMSHIPFAKKRIDERLNRLEDISASDRDSQQVDGSGNVILTTQSEDVAEQDISGKEP